MVVTTSRCSEQQSSGLNISNGQSIRWTLQSVWHWSNLPASWSLESMTIIGWTLVPISQSQENLPSTIGTLWMISRSPRGTWCDTCKQRWGTEHWKGQTQAVWQTTSKRHGKVIVRHYCQPCADYAQAWHNGTTWTLQQQIDYAKGIQELDVRFE